MTLTQKLPGSIFARRNGRFWWTVKLPGLARKGYPLVPEGASAATMDRSVAEAVALAMWEKAARDEARRQENNREPESPLTVAELIERYLAFLETELITPSGQVSREVTNIREAVKHLKPSFAYTAAENFKSTDLEKVRDEMVALVREKKDRRGNVIETTKRLCRSTINSRINKIRRMFKWAWGRRLIPQNAYLGLTAIEGIRKGRKGTREGRKVRPVAERVVRMTMPYTTPTVRDMMELQLLTGMRPGEVCRLQFCEVEVGGEIWFYRPSVHKTDIYESDRIVALGPKAQAILERRMPTKQPSDFVFSPEESRVERNAAKRAARKSKVQPSQVDRRKPAEERQTAPTDHYEPKCYRNAILYAIKKGNAQLAAEAEAKGVTEWERIPHWFPYQIRHTTATLVRKEFGDKGRETAKAVLGHKTLSVTDNYAEIDMELAVAAARKLG